MIRWLIWFAIRIVFTIACMFTMQNIIGKLGYTIPSSTMIVSSVIIILAIRMWSSNPKEN